MQFKSRCFISIVFWWAGMANGNKRFENNLFEALLFFSYIHQFDRDMLNSVSRYLVTRWGWIDKCHQIETSHSLPY